MSKNIGLWMGKGKPENGTTSAYSYCVDLTSACLRPCFMLDLLTVLRSTGTFTQHLTKFMFGVLYFNMPFINDLGSTIDTDVFCFVSTFFRADLWTFFVLYLPFLELQCFRLELQEIVSQAEKSKIAVSLSCIFCWWEERPAIWSGEA